MAILEKDNSSPQPFYFAESASAFAGAEMDAPMAAHQRRRRFVLRWAWIAGPVFLAILLAILLSGQRLGDLTVRAGDLEIAMAAPGAVQEERAFSGLAVPVGLQLIISEQPGQIAEAFVKDGESVAKGAALLRIANSDRELEIRKGIVQAEAEINSLIAQTGSLQQAALQSEKDLLQAEYDLAELRTKVQQRDELAKAGFFPRQQLESMQGELRLKESLLAKSREVFQSQKSLREEQSRVLQRQRQAADENLARAKRQLDSFIIRAPLAGKVLALESDLGKSLPGGAQVAQIDGGGGLEVRASVDQRSINAVRIGQEGTIQIDGRDYPLSVQAVSSKIVDGSGEIRLRFKGEVPAGLRAGQAFSGRLPLGARASGIVLPNAPFLEVTGGNWIFVLDAKGRFATRRNIVSGPRSLRQVLIEQGLKPGERAIISSYANFGRAKRIRIQ